MASTLQELHNPGQSSLLNITFLSSEWGSRKGGLSALNRELAIQLARCPEVKITILVPQCSEKDKKIAFNQNIRILEPKRQPDVLQQLDWLSFPPEHLPIDVIVGHGVKLGRQAQFIRESRNCKWVQVVHTVPEKLEMYKKYPNTISKDEEKHFTEVKLCELANCVVGVGPKLSEYFCAYLGWCEIGKTVFDLTPGIFDEFVRVKQAPNERKHYRILVCGCGDTENFELKGFDIAAKAVVALSDVCLVVVDVPLGKREEIEKQFTGCGVPASRLRVRDFAKSQEDLRKLFCEVDLALMPSSTEDFGLTALQALSAGLPVLVSKNSGFGEALSQVPFGSSLVVDSENPEAWIAAIKKIWDKDRTRRLKEVEALRDSYGKKYSWVKQAKCLVEMMTTLAHDVSHPKNQPSQQDDFSVHWQTLSEMQSSEELRQEIEHLRCCVQELEGKLKVNKQKLKTMLSNTEKKMYDAASVLKSQELEITQLRSELAQTNERITVLENEIIRREQQCNLMQNQLQMIQSGWIIQQRDVTIDKSNCLGEGAYGTVHKGTFHGSPVAIKELYQKTTAKLNRELVCEINVAVQCHHSKVLKIFGAVIDGERPLIVMELLDCNLRNVMDSYKGHLPSQTVKSVALDIAQGLWYLHSKNPPIVHRDIKTRNILMMKEGDVWKAKTGDHVVTKVCSKKMTPNRGALLYAAPEAQTHDQQSPKVDVYSFGVVFLEMYTGQCPELGQVPRQCELIKNSKLKEVIQLCTHVNHTERPAMEDVVKSLEGDQCGQLSASDFVMDSS